jgi:HlyD family secretion protein
MWSRIRSDTGGDWMTTDLLADKEGQLAQTAGKVVPGRSTRGARWGWGGLAVVFLALGTAGGFWLTARGEHHAKNSERDRHSESSTVAKVQVARPERGGMERVTSQPGTIRAFEFAPLFSKVSGFVNTLNVDRGSRVKKGDLLAKIYDPERDVAVLQTQASLDHAKATVAQAQADILTAEASVSAAKAKQHEAKATHDQMTAKRDYRRKEYQRISDLVARGSVEEKLKDEQLDEYHSSEAALLSSEAGIETAAALLAEAQAKVEKAKADKKAAEAQVEVASANLQMAKVFVEYTKILSPYDGVVIYRGESVHPGSFVRAADEGGNQPLLTVAMVSKMRTIVPIPDREVPYCNVGDPATVTIDALGSRIFPGKISRVAESEDVNDRTMRAEIDLDNSDGLLRDGMFGRAFIVLEKLITNLAVPSSCLINRNGKGEGAVLVVKDGKVHRAKVHVGMDTGLLAEIVDGLSENDQVILQPDPSVAEGTDVEVVSVASPPKKVSGTE